VRKILSKVGGSPLEKTLIASTFAFAGRNYKVAFDDAQFWVNYRLHPLAHQSQVELRSQVLENDFAFEVPASNWQVAVVGVRSADAEVVLSWLVQDRRFQLHACEVASGVNYESSWQPLHSITAKQLQQIVRGSLQVLISRVGDAVSESSSIPLEIWGKTKRNNFSSPGWNGAISEIGASDAPAELLELDRQIVANSFHNINFDIDAVYLWVDGADPEWQRRKSEFSGKGGTHGTSASRFTSRNELFFSIATLRRNAPWINRIWLVTDGQTPDLGELAEHVTIVDHTEFIPKEFLPTFNSHVITAHLHKIKGLSEHFLYLNDDILFGRQLLPTVWFDSLGRSIVRYTRTTLPGFSVANPEVIHRARQHTVRAAMDAGLKVSTRSIQHGPHPMRKSVMQKAWSKFNSELTATSENRFRTDDDIVPEWLHNFVSYSEGSSVIGGRLTYTYIVLNSKAALGKILDLAVRRPPSVICLNDVSEIANAERVSEQVAEYRLKKISSLLLKGASR